MKYRLNQSNTPIVGSMFLVALNGDFYLTDEKNLLDLIDKKVRKGIANNNNQKIIMNHLGEYAPSELRDFFRGVYPVEVKDLSFDVPESWAQGHSLPADLPNRLKIKISLENKLE